MKTCVYQDPGERSSDPTSDRARFPFESLGVPVEAWEDSGLLRSQGTEYNSPESRRKLA